MAKATAGENRVPNAVPTSRLRPASTRDVIRSHGKRPASTFSERKSLEQLAAEQGVRPTRLEDILGKGADLWQSDQEFEEFVKDIYTRRREDRQLAKHRGADRSIRRKRGDTLVGTLRREYGEDFAAGYRSDMRLDKLLTKEGVESLSDLVRRRRREHSLT